MYALIELWVQYFKLVSVSRLVVIERHGDGHIQMCSVQRMIGPTIPTFCFVHSLCTISSSAPATDAQTGKQHCT